MEYKDIVHNIIEIPMDIQTIIQTPQFQRLKRIKQLGIIYKLYPDSNITHTRYDHCIGTYFLAKKLLDSLESNTKGLNIPAFYKNAVATAALLHDVGHAPFSHMWESLCGGEYNHEGNSKSCIDEIFKVYRPEWMAERVTYGIELIKSFIVGDSSCLENDDADLHFLFDIVNNKQCNVDVDKWDYLRRDYIYIKDTLKLDVNLDYDDVFMKAIVDGAHIKYRYRDFKKIYNIFDARATFHIHTYRNPKVVCLEQIFNHVLSQSENDLECIDGINIKQIRSAHTNAFLKFYDDEIWRILKNLTSHEMVPFVKCLENGSITEIYPRADEEKIAVPHYLKVKTKIPYAGEEMKEENILFFGDKKEKPVFDQKKGFTEYVSYFQIKN